MTPTMGHPMSTTNTPPRKNPVAFILCFWKKKRKVLSSPMTKASPATNRIYRGRGKWRRVTVKNHTVCILHTAYYTSVSLQPRGISGLMEQFCTPEVADFLSVCCYILNPLSLSLVGWGQLEESLSVLSRDDWQGLGQDSGWSTSADS